MAVSKQIGIAVIHTCTAESLSSNLGRATYYIDVLVILLSTYFVIV
jgi:hypothetical protein